MNPDVRWIEFACPQCGGALTAAVEHVGCAVRCPLCHGAVTIPSPEAAAPKRPSGGEYALHGDDDVTAAASIAQPTVSVDRSPHSELRPSVELAGEGYAVREEPIPTRPEPPWRAMRHSRVYGGEAGERPPRWPLLLGVFEFPFRRDAIPCLLHLWFWGLPTFFSFFIAAGMAGWLDQYENSDRIMGVWKFAALAATLTAPWLALSFACGLTILSDTAAGHGQIDEWPRLLEFVDGFGDAFFVVNSLVLSALAAAGFEWLVDWAGRASCLAGLTVRPGRVSDVAWLIGWPGSAPHLALLALFPIILLSMLERDSRITPFSPLVLRSLRQHWLAWTVFYAESAFLAALAYAAMLPVLHSESGLLVWLLCPLILSAALMIYFRLLGRLAWCCSDRGE